MLLLVSFTLHAQDFLQQAKDCLDAGKCNEAKDFYDAYLVEHPQGNAEVKRRIDECGKCPSIVKDFDGNTYHTVQIGSQCWMKENMRTMHFQDGTNIQNGGDDFSYDSFYWYYPHGNPYEKNTYGLLYNYAAAVQVCPQGWHLPTIGEWGLLDDFLNNNKSTSYSSDFNALGAGFAFYTDYDGHSCYDEREMDSALFWSATSSGKESWYSSMYYDADYAFHDADYAFSFKFGESSPYFYYDDCQKTCGLSVRCVRGEKAGVVSIPKSLIPVNGGEKTSAEPYQPSGAPPCPGMPTVTDYDGNVYHTLWIDSQCWMKENLRVKHYADGTPIVPGFSIIEHYEDGTTYTMGAKEKYPIDICYSLTGVPSSDGILVDEYRCHSDYTPFWYYPDGDPSNEKEYGLLYNWPAARKACPEGWHIPDDILENDCQLAGYVAQGDEDGPWPDAGGYDEFGSSAHFWFNSGSGIFYKSIYICRSGNPEACRTTHKVWRFGNGFSVRCVRDESNEGVTDTQPFVDDYSAIDGKPCERTPTMKDAEGNEYPTVQIGSQCWMAQNIRSDEFPGKITYDTTTSTHNYWGDDEKNYNWYAAVRVCPEGWHLPTDDEWTQLTDYLCHKYGERHLAKVLASSTGWEAKGVLHETFSDTIGFAVYPIGCEDFNWLWDYWYKSGKGLGAFFWSASSSDEWNAWCRSLNYYDTDVFRYAEDKDKGFSVRCLRDESASTSQQPDTLSANIEFTVNGIAFNMIYVEGGTFTMGCTSEQGNDCRDDERPAHKVTLGSFYMGETEVTQGLWRAVMGSEPSYKGWTNEYGLGISYPAYWLSWDECQEFIKKLNRLASDQLPVGWRFALPTEAQWEFAARGGNEHEGYKYSGSNNINDVAWFYDNSYAKGSSSPDYGTHPVKSKQPNELGLYDMSGNVWEWCQDVYNKAYYEVSPSTDPAGPPSAAGGPSHVLRGGSWAYSEYCCRVTYRDCMTPTPRDYMKYCFRLALVQQ